MIAILWFTGIVTLMLGIVLLLPGSVTKLSNAINRVIATIDHEEKLKATAVIVLFLLCGCSFFLIYYYSR